MRSGFFLFQKAPFFCLDDVFTFFASLESALSAIVFFRYLNEGDLSCAERHFVSF